MHDARTHALKEWILTDDSMNQGKVPRWRSMWTGLQLQGAAHIEPRPLFWLSQRGDSETNMHLVFIYKHLKYISHRLWRLSAPPLVSLSFCVLFCKLLMSFFREKNFQNQPTTVAPATAQKQVKSNSPTTYSPLTLVSAQSSLFSTWMQFWQHLPHHSHG